tara:strand:- start:2738 stop:2905 length:168 start_codon:yes stop_codon:yes gene_type:complete
VALLDGSIVRTAILTPRLLKKFPNASMNVLFPAPGTPVIPILMVFLFLGLRLARI